MNFYSFDGKGIVIGFGLIFCCSAAFYAFFSFSCGVSHWRKRMREWVLWLQVSTGSCPSGHCITSSYGALVFLLPNSTSKEGKAAGVPHIAWGEMYLNFYLLTFCNCCRDFKEQEEAEVQSSFRNEHKVFQTLLCPLIIFFFLWLGNKIFLFLKITPNDSPPTAGFKFHTNDVKNNW